MKKLICLIMLLGIVALSGCKPSVTASVDSVETENGTVNGGKIEVKIE